MQRLAGGYNPSATRNLGQRIINQALPKVTLRNTTFSRSKRHLIEFFQ